MRWAGGGDGDGEIATGLGLEAGEGDERVAAVACGPPQATRASVARIA